MPATINGPLIYIFDAPTRRITAISSRAVYIARRIVASAIMVEAIAKSKTITSPALRVAAIAAVSLSIRFCFVGS